MTNPNLTSLTLIADRSGSMFTIAEDVNGGMRRLLEDQADVPGECKVDVVTFDTAIEHIIEDAPLQVALDYPRPFVLPRGGTALNDAVGKTVVTLGERFAALAEDERPGHVIVVIATDGEENSSHDWSTSAVQDLVKQQTEEWGWVFIYLAANVDAFATGAGLGFARGQTMNYAPSAGGVGSVYAAASASVIATRGGTVRDFTDEERAAAEK